MLSELAIEYFDAFTKADIARLKTCFSNDVKLHDWNTNVCGVELVLHEYSKIFQSLGEAIVTVVSLHEMDSKVIAELKITANQLGTIEVVDIISFNKKKKINSIRAYKG